MSPDACLYRPRSGDLFGVSEGGGGTSNRNKTQSVARRTLTTFRVVSVRSVRGDPEGGRDPEWWGSWEWGWEGGGAEITCAHPGGLELCGPVGFVWGHRIIGTVKRGPRIPKKPIELGIRGRTPALQDDLHVSVRASWVPGWGNSTCSFLLKIGKFEIQKNDEWKPTRVGAGSTTWVGHRVPSPCIRDTVSRP